MVQGTLGISLNEKQTNFLLKIIKRSSQMERGISSSDNIIRMNVLSHSFALFVDSMLT